MLLAEALAEPLIDSVAETLAAVTEESDVVKRVDAIFAKLAPMMIRHEPELRALLNIALERSLEEIHERHIPLLSARWIVAWDGVLEPLRRKVTPKTYAIMVRALGALLSVESIDVARRLPWTNKLQQWPFDLRREPWLKGSHPICEQASMKYVLCPPCGTVFEGKTEERRDPCHAIARQGKAQLRSAARRDTAGNDGRAHASGTRPFRDSAGSDTTSHDGNVAARLTSWFDGAIVCYLNGDRRRC